MPSKADFDALVEQFNVATNDIAARIQRLIDKIGSGMSDAEEAEVKAALEAAVAQLSALGKDPDEPVPA